MKKFIIILLFTVFILTSTNIFAYPASLKEYIVDSVVTKDGRVAIAVIVPGKPPENYRAPIAYPTKSSVILPQVPAFNWSFGCSATSASMIAGHYDNMGYPNMYAGTTNGGLMPMNNSSWPDVWINGELRHQCPLSATRNGVDGRTTKGHVDDYWIGSGAQGPDPWVGSWPEHAYGECTADYMKTNQWIDPPNIINNDGSTAFWYWDDGAPMTESEILANGLDNTDGAYGFKLFCESRGYTVNDLYTQQTVEEGLTYGFSYNDFKDEIDAGHPVLIQVTDHTMVGYGYDDGGGTNTIYIHDTWDYSDHTMTWAGWYSGGYHHYAVTVLELAPSTINVWTGNSGNYWSTSGNWSLGHVPTAAEDVEIPNVNMPCIVVYSDKVCRDIEIYPGATVNICGKTLTVNNDLINHGTIGMLQDNSYLNIMHDVVWESGSSLNVTAYSSYINVYGDWNFENGANVNPTQGFVDFRGTTGSWIRCYSTNSNFYILRNYKSGGAKAIVSNLSTEDLVINNLVYTYPNSILESMSNQNIIMRGDFNYYGTFDFTQLGNTGSVIFDGTAQNINNYNSGSGIFNNVVFSASTGATLLNDDMTVMGDLTIEQGNFNPGDNTVTVGGDWTNTVGTAGFTEGTGRVVFNSSSHQYCYGETFNILELNRPMTDFVIPNSTTTTCQQLDWTDYNGELEVDGGTFIAYDLEENGIFGKYFVTSNGGLLELHQDNVQYVDLNGQIVLSGGTMNVYGGNGSSYWPYAANATITMYNGVLDFKDVGIYIFDPGTYSLTESITGGTIRTVGEFIGNRTDFNPTGGTIELYGTVDADLSMGTGSNFYDVEVNKSTKAKSGNSKDKEYVMIENRDGTRTRYEKSDAITLTSDCVVTNNLAITEGSLTLNGYELTVDRHCVVYGTLNMTNDDDVLNVGTYNWDNLTFYSGSTGNISKGEIYLKSWITPHAGSSFTASINNTIYFIGSNSSGGLCNDEPTAVYGNIDVNKSANRIYLDYMATEPIIVNGNFVIHADNILEMSNETLVVHGNFTDNSTSSVYVYSVTKVRNNATSSGEIRSSKDSGTKGGYLEIDTDFTLNGLMDLGSDGNVLLHGLFELATTGTLTIDGGSFISDAALSKNKAWQYLRGTMNLSDGLFEITNNHISIQSTFVDNISGGIIRTGGTFGATASNTFQPTGGVVELTSQSSGYYIRCINGNYLYNLKVNSLPSILLYDDITVQNNVEINSGILNTYGYDMHVGGDWTNTVGTAGFTEGTGRVIFNSDVHQYCYGETFNILELNKPMADFVIPNSTTTTCQQLDWTDYNGELEVDGGTFIAYDLEENGIYGKYYITSNGGLLELHQDNVQYVDLNGQIVLSGGTMNVYGGNGSSYWPFAANATITMYNGVLDFKDVGIYIYDSGTYTLTENITGGTIRTPYSFMGDRTDFNPAAGTFEFYGSTDATIYQSNGCTFYNVNIDKSTKVKSGNSKDKEYVIIENRDGIRTRYEKSSTITFTSDCVVTNNLAITEGSLTLNGLELTVARDCDVYGTLNMPNDDDVLNVGTYDWDNLTFYSGSTGNISKGEIYLKSWIVPHAGSSFTASINNTIYFIGSNSSGGLCNDEPTAVYGNIDVNKSANRIYLDYTATEPIIVNGNFVIHADNILEMSNETLVVHGNFTDNSTSSIYVYDATKEGEDATSSGEIRSSKDSGTKGGYLEIDTDFTLNGLLDLGDGDVLINGHFNLAITGELNIDGGSFSINDTVGSWDGISGTFNMSDGLYFSNKGPWFTASANSTISGGLIDVDHFGVTYPGNFEPTGGTVEISHDDSYYGHISCSNGNYFHDLKISGVSYFDGGYLVSDITVQNDLEIESGQLWFNAQEATVYNDVIISGGLKMQDTLDVLNAGNNSSDEIIWNSGSYTHNVSAGTINVYGIWTFADGTNAQLGTGNTVYFDGSTASSILCNDSDAEFGTLIIDKTAGPSADTYIHASSTETVRVSGDMTVSAGNQFHIQDRDLIVQDTLDIVNTGEMDMMSGGNLTNNSDFTLNGLLDVDAGNVLLHGIFELTSTGTLTIDGGSFISDAPFKKGKDRAWQYLRGTFNLSDGLFEITYNSPYFTSTCIDNITGGIIRTGEAFYADDGIFQPSGGTVELVGSLGNTIYCLGNSYFHNLVIDKTSPGCSALYSDLDVKNNLHILSGSLDNSYNNYDIYVGGDWTNNVGDAGFVEGTGTVTFNGSYSSYITTDETFYNLTAANPIYTGWKIPTIHADLTITVTNDLNINSGCMKVRDNSIINVGNDLIILDNAGLDMSSYYNQQINVGGDWTNNNSTYTTWLGFHPGNNSTVSFSGSSDQYLTTQAPQEDLGNLVIDKSRGEFRSNDNIRVMHDLDILAGNWHDNVSSLTHYFEGDFYVTAGTAAGFNSLTNNIVVFKGTADQNVYNPNGYHYFGDVIVDKTAWPTRSADIHEGTEMQQVRINNDNLTEETLSLTVTLTSNIDIQMGNGLTIEEGMLDLNGNNLYTMGDVIINDGGTLIVDDGAQLQVYGGDELAVNSGGTLEVLGTSGNLATVTHRSTGNYDFNVYAGGTISAEYATFKYMSANGVYVKDGGLIDGVHSFNNCFFDYGAAAGTLLRIDNDQTFTADNVNFPTNTWSGASNVYKNLNQGHVTFTSATGGFAGPMYEDDTFDRIHWTGFGPDLTITNAVWSDMNPYVCDMIDVAVTVKNIGNVDVTEWFCVDVYYNLPSPPSWHEYGDKAEYVGGLPAGDSLTVNFNDITRTTGTIWSSYFQVDADSFIAELDEDNNVWGPDAITWNAIPAIDDLAIHYNAGNIELNWSYTAVADSFYIYRDTDPYFIPVYGTPYVSIDGVSTSWNEPATGTIYFYIVTAVKSCPSPLPVIMNNKEFKRISNR